MGNHQSIAELPPEWEDVLPYITRDDIVRASRGSGLRFDLDEHVPIAVAVLRAQPQLRDIRFKLVPSRMTEEMFWAAIFSILNDDGLGTDDLIEIIKTDDGANGSRKSGESDMLLSPIPQCPETKGKAAKHEKKKSIRTPISHLERAYFDSDDALDTSSDTLEEIETPQAHIARLQKSLREANHKIRQLALELYKERRKHHGEGRNEEVCTETRKSSTISECSHLGSWEIDPDCTEFLELDDNLKENLRQEKVKRLKEVKAQMKFILDSDDIKDAHGKWTCCGSEIYNSECCA